MVLWEIVPIWIHIPLGYITGVTFPIMAFFVVEGFRRTRNIKRYMFRLLIFAVIAQVPYMLAFGVLQLNIVFTILLGLLCLCLHEKLYVEKGKKALFVIIFIAILIVATFVIEFEGGLAGLLMIFLYKVIKDEMKRRTVPLIVWGGFMVISTLITTAGFALAETVGMDMSKMLLEVGRLGEYMNMMMHYLTIPIGTFLIIPLLRAYNGQLGRRAKYLFYSFYPLHFVVLVIIGVALGLFPLAMPW